LLARVSECNAILIYANAETLIFYSNNFDAINIGLKPDIIIKLHIQDIRDEGANSYEFSAKNGELTMSIVNSKEFVANIAAVVEFDKLTIALIKENGKVFFISYKGSSQTQDEEIRRE